MRKNYFLLLAATVMLGITTTFGQVAKSKLHYSQNPISEKEAYIQKQKNEKSLELKKVSNLQNLYSTSVAKGVSDCPGSSLFSNPLVDYGSASTSEYAMGYAVAQSFVADGSIDSITFWGINAYNDGAAWSVCDNESPMIFDLVFYEMDGQSMGDEFQSLVDIEATSEGTGILFADSWEIMKYTIVLPTPITELSKGFASIIGKSDNSCWFLWIDAPTGNGMAYQYSDDAGTWALAEFPYAICVAGELSACPAPVDLTATNITLEQADLGWTELGTAANWRVNFSEIYNEQVSSTIFDANDDMLTVMGLVGNNEYTFEVQSVCGVGDTSNWSAPYMFNTPCDVVTAYPFMEDFDGDWNTWCWTVVDADIDEVTWNRNNAYITPTHSGEYAAHGMGNQDDWLISPPMQLDGDYQFSWWDKVESASYNNVYEILVSTTGSALEDFTNYLTEVDCSNEDWMQHIVYLSAYTGQTVYVAIHQTYSGSGWYGFGIDDVEVDVAPTCPPVTNIFAENVTMTSADISWLESGAATAWNIEYGMAGFEMGSGTEVAVTENPYQITGLTEGNYYEVYVQANCGTETSTWAGPFMFNTACDVLTDIVEGFETSVPPICWMNFANGSGTKVWEQSGTTINSGTYSAKAAYENSGSTNEKWLVSGKVTVPIGKALSFYATDGLTSDYGSTLEVKVSTDADGMNTEAYVDLLTINEADVVNGVMSPFSVDVASYEGQDVFFAFVMFDNDGDNWYLDDVAFISCGAPTGLSVSDITTTSATLHWVSNADNFVVEYGTEGFVQGSGTSVDLATNSLAIESLTANTMYEFYVKAICGTEDESTWAGPFVFSTSKEPCANITTFPYFQGFEGQVEFDCWTPMYNTASDGGLNGANLTSPPTENTWFVLDPTGFSGNGANYIYEGVRSAAIGYSAPDFNWLISPNIVLPADREADMKFMIWNKDSVEANWITLFHVNVFDGASWVNVLTFDETTESNLFEREVVVDLNSYAGTTVQVAFIFEYNDGYELAIDNITIDSYVGVQSNKELVTNLYPNPTSGMLFIEGEFETNTTINVMDVSGKLIMTRIDNSNKVSVDLSNLENGLYFIEVTSGNEKATYRAIKE